LLQDTQEDLHTVVLVSQDTNDHHQEGNIISIEDAAGLAANGFAFVEIPANVNLAENDTIVLQSHVQNS
jgi:hypothetical protein